MTARTRKRVPETDPVLASVQATLAALVDVVHRMDVSLRCKLSPPARQLTLAQAARQGLPRRTLERLVAAGVFTDDRAGKRRGSPVKLYEDELKAWRTDGESGVRRVREAMGRD